MKRTILKKRFLIPLCAVALALIALIIVYFSIILPQRKANERNMEILRHHYNTRVAQFMQENAEYDDYEADVAFIGDSLTEGYDLATFYPQYVTANRGIGGDTPFGLQERLKVSLYDLKP